MVWNHYGTTTIGEWRECKVGMGLRKETSRMKIYSNCMWCIDAKYNQNIV